MSFPMHQALRMAAAAAVALLITSTPTPAAEARTDAARHAADEIVLPAGTLLPLTLETRVSSATSRVEDTVRARLRRPVAIGPEIVLPAGTPVIGFVSEATRSGRVKGRARLALRFTRLVVDGDSHAIRTSSVVRQAPATKKKDAATIGVPAGAGAVIGGILDGKGGAAKGAAIGGAGGTGVVLATRGREVGLGPGAAISVRLTRAVAIER